MNFGPEDPLVEQIFQVNQAEQHFISDQLKQLHLNLLQARTLHFIAQYPGAIQKQLSHYLGKQDATTTNILKLLESRQLITRRVQATNERQKQLYLLPDGQEMITKIRAIFSTLEDQVSTPLSVTEKQTLLQLLQRVNAHLTHD